MGRIWTVDGEDMFLEDVILVRNWEVLVSRKAWEIYLEEWSEGTVYI